ncbi:hypothetical protein AMECASPLE_032921 [Ameca splendens]|uniref:Uncharacterized protein n=1 Tax=Ameca splendens TaxID=208324 RepID=A0ABV0Y793_9TELE
MNKYILLTLQPFRKFIEVPLQITPSSTQTELKLRDRVVPVLASCNQTAWVQNPDLSQDNKTRVPVARRPRDCSPRLGARLMSGARAADPRTDRRAREHQVTCPPSSRTRTEPGEPDPRCPAERSRYRPGIKLRGRC